MAKPNYRHQKKQKEQARKLRQAAKQNRRLGVRSDAAGTADTSEPAATEADVTVVVAQEEA